MSGQDKLALQGLLPHAPAPASQKAHPAPAPAPAPASQQELVHPAPSEHAHPAPSEHAHPAPSEHAHPAPSEHAIPSQPSFLVESVPRTVQNVSENSQYLDRFTACMILGAAADALAFRNGDWEFLRDGAEIHRQIAEMGGVDKLTQEGLLVSDDTVMHLATARGLIRAGKSDDMELAFNYIADEYVKCMDDMMGRAPGMTCIKNARILRPFQPMGYVIPFEKAGGGCGGAMRSMCIGLRYPHEKDEPKLIALAVESGRMTHNHPTGYLGSLTSALFTAYAIRGVPTVEWGRSLIKTLPSAKQYVFSTKRDLKETEENWSYFETRWKEYLKTRKIDANQPEPTFPPNYGVEERDLFYSEVSWDGWGGSSGHDAPMIAYDAFLGCGGDWIELAKRGFFHGGDSDSTGIIAACWFGALHGYSTVPSANYEAVEKMHILAKAAKDLYNLAF